MSRQFGTGVNGDARNQHYACLGIGLLLEGLELRDADFGSVQVRCLN